MTTTSTSPAAVAYALRWPALFVLLAAEVMDLLDDLITSIAGPTIVRDLGGGQTLIQWLAAAYTLAMASGLLIGGRLGDIYGRRRMFLVGMSGFTGSGYPKSVPRALARRIDEAHARGQPFKIGVWTGASTAPELDGALARVNGIELRLPYQSDPTTRQRINEGTIEYTDIHLSHVAQFVWFPAAPLWSFMIILLDVTIIYQLTARWED